MTHGNAVADLPDDLKPITLYQSGWPEHVPLDIDECRTALYLAAGDVTQAATHLRTTSIRLRKFVKKQPLLTNIVNEFSEQLKDRATCVVREALYDTDPTRTDSMARWVLSGLGKDRGFGGNAPGMNVNTQGGNVTLQWGDGQSVTVSPTREEHNIIDITPTERCDGE